MKTKVFVNSFRTGLGALSLTLALASTARAQEESDLLLVAQQSGAAPNVVILFDTSGSMQHIVWSPEFDAKKFYDIGSKCPDTAYDVVPRANTIGKCPSSGDPQGSCPDNDAEYFASNDVIRCPRTNFPLGCLNTPLEFACRFVTVSGQQKIEIKLPDYDTTTDTDPNASPALTPPVTWFSTNYLHWFMNRLAAGSFPVTNFTKETRKMTAKRVIRDLVDNVNPDLATGGYKETVRFGLARLHGNNTSPNNNGGFMVQPIAANNKSALKATLNTLPANGGTPLSEALVDIARYYTGQFSNLGAYPKYARNTTTGATTATPPVSPLEVTVLCRENFVILITDGEPSVDGNDHYPAGSTANFLSTFGADYDQDGNANINATAGDALDDIAKYLYDKDLVPNTTLPGKQHLITYTVGFGLDTDLLNRTAQDGHGQYFSATSATQLAEQLQAAVEDIVLRSASFTAASVPASRTAFGNGFFNAVFEPRAAGDLYVGHLEAYRISGDFDILDKNGVSAIDPNTGEFLEPHAPFWDAALTLADPNNARNMYTKAALTNTRLDFTAANLSAADLGVLTTELLLFPNDPNVPFATIETLADAVVEFVRGNDSFDFDRDTNKTERREVVLGDIFHSNPVVIGPPSAFLASETGYGPIGDPNSFVEKYGKRRRAIYAGANDGVFHAFNAGSYRTGNNPLTPETETAYYDLGTGVELFGYVPRLLMSRLDTLPRSGPKPIFVDGETSGADVWLPTSASDVTKDTAEWNTAMMVGMRNGGDGYVALDVTDPNATAVQPHGAYPRLLWEFTDVAGALARTWSRPVITRVKMKASFNKDYCGPNDGDGLNTVSSPNGNCREEWVAIFGAGYREQANPNHTTYVSDPNAPTFSNDSMGIYIVRMSDGSVLSKVNFDPNDPTLKEMKYSIPSEPAVLDLNFDGFADLLYVGDLGGNMWKWDISKVGVIGTSGRVETTTWPIGRFFAAPKATNNHYRQIFFAPSASFVDDKLTIAFGTGERANLQYATTNGVDENRFYVVRDDTPIGTGSIPSTPYLETNLSLLNGLGEDPNTTDQGFYIVATKDEKFVTSSLAFEGFVLSASYVPDLTTTSGTCEAAGDAFLYVFLLDTGEGYYEAETTPDGERRLSIGGGLPTSPRISIGEAGDSASAVIQTSDGRLITPSLPPPSRGAVEQVFWRQMF